MPSQPTSPTPKQPTDTSSRLSNAQTNLSYLLLGPRASVAPASLKTRSLLKTTRYVVRYLFHRLIRYAKYALVGAAIATVGGGLLGSVGSGLAFFAAPGIGVGMAMGVITAMIKFGWRHRGNHLRGGIWDGWQDMKTRAQEERDGAEDEAQDACSEQERQNVENKTTRANVWMRV
ncbi:uncharacterized protein L203_101354 [Cryptococcus depauperatus CBS 7841]|uniref:Uncharacterized protein n=1 Tax=Cryptococcus depauperatus CBS 7841 TaxID=1295531 RepID=A0A1E3ICE8_9TREE|nr:hypothetical protein L203_04286 [Cryptococcus depauperatus CBS 7841]